MRTCSRKPLTAWGGQFNAGFGERRVVAQQGVVGALADDDAAVAGNAFKAAGQVHLAARKQYN